MFFDFFKMNEISTSLKEKTTSYCAERGCFLYDFNSIPENVAGFSITIDTIDVSFNEIKKAGI